MLVGFDIIGSFLSPFLLFSVFNKMVSLVCPFEQYYASNKKFCEKKTSKGFVLNMPKLDKSCIAIKVIIHIGPFSASQVLDVRKITHS